jgi:putative transcriptional regulator
MIKEDFDSLQRGLAQVAAFKAGERDGFVVHEPVNVKAIRKLAGKTQEAFASAYHIPVGTLRDWEQGRRQPDAPARSLLAIISRDPATVERLLAQV